MPSEKNAGNADELELLLNELKEKTGIRFSVREDNPAGREETLNQIRALLSHGSGFRDKGDFIRRIMTGESDRTSVYDGMKKLHMDAAAEWLVFLIETAENGGAMTESVLKTLFFSPASSMVIRMDGTHTALVKRNEAKGTPAQETAQTICDMLSSEAMLNASVSYTVVPRKTEDLAEAYRDAAATLKIGCIFYAQDHIFPSNRLGIARLIYGLPEDICENYLREIFGSERPEEPDGETLHIISAFFENGLNIAETARQLYMHRNTLVYRLEKISRATGLDIRKFDDAITWKIASMIEEYVKFKRRARSYTE